MSTFGDLAAFVADDLNADGDSQFTLPQSAPYFSTPFGKRLAVWLQWFSVETCCLFTPKVAITVGAGDQTFSLADPANCAKSLHLITKLWLNNSEIPKVPSVQQLHARLTTTDADGVPTGWAPLNKTTILFDRNPAGAIADSYVAGFYRHPLPTADDMVVEISGEEWPFLAKVLAIAMREQVVADDAGFQRLARIDQDAAGYIARKKHEFHLAYYGVNG